MGLMWIAEIHLRLRSTQPRLSPLISINTNRYISRDPYAWGYLHRALECRASFKRASETLKDFANLTLPNELLMQEILYPYGQSARSREIQYSCTSTSVEY